MTRKKYVINADGVTKMVLQNINVRSKGGHSSGVPYQYNSQKAEKNNTIQRRKKRRNTIYELIINNFQPTQCRMVTLTFDDRFPPGWERQKPALETELDFVLDPDCETDSNPVYLDGEVIIIDRVECIYDSYWGIPFPLDVDNLEEYADKYYEEHFNFSQEEHDEFNRIHDAEIILAKADPEVYGAEPNEESLKEEPYKDISICNNEFKKFIQKIHYRFDAFRYVAVIGKQIDGNYHYHMICNLPYIESAEMQDIWAHGAVNIRYIRDLDSLKNVAKY